MNGKQRLELNWIGKEELPRLEPRILMEDPALSYHADKRVTDDDLFDNRLIFGDNLLALKALEQEFAGQVKCIYIDPPYNTGNAFEYYDDGVEHSLWLSLMRDRIDVLRTLLRPDGFICVHIDDSEGHYLKVLLDEIFGRDNYLTTLYVQVRYASKTLKQDMNFHKQIEMIHVYRKNYGAVPILTTKANTDEKFCYYVTTAGHGKEVTMGGKKVEIFGPDQYTIKKGDPSENGLKEIWATGSILDGNSSGRFFRDNLAGRVAQDGLGTLYRVYGIGDDNHPYRYFTGPRREGATKGKYFQGIPMSKLDSDEASTTPMENFYDLAGAFGNCRHEGGVEFRSGKKPEILLQLVLRHFSSPGDWVLDSFAGSGTTGAVAHKMGRRWIMVELGEHCHTHIIPRLKSVIEGSDQTGITEVASWRGGGGFRYFGIAPSLLERDRFGNWVISRSYNPVMLAQAVCGLMGFSYAPSQEPDEYWRHGHSTETDFIYVTTQALTHDALKIISEEVGSERTLLICCKAFNANEASFQNLTLRKIPKAVLSRCEWGRDDYSLAVSALPTDSIDDPAAPEPAEPKRRGRPAKAASEPSLFDLAGEEEAS